MYPIDYAKESDMWGSCGQHQGREGTGVYLGDKGHTSRVRVPLTDPWVLAVVATPQGSAYEQPHF